MTLETPMMTPTTRRLRTLHRPLWERAVLRAGGVGVVLAAAGQYWYWFSSGVPAAES